MRLLAGLLLTLLLATLGHARSVRQPRQLKGGLQIPTLVEHPLEKVVVEEDPDWIPTAEDYADLTYDTYEDEDYLAADPTYDTYEDEDDLAADPNWEPTADDYVEDYDDEYYEYDVEGDDNDGAEEEVEETDEDELWSSDDDPDWYPVDNGYEDYDYGEDITSEEDPDWVPTAEDYADAEQSEEIDDDYDDQHATDGHEEQDEDYDEKTRLEEVIFDIALLASEREEAQVDVAPGADVVFAIADRVRNLNMSLDEALNVLSLLEAEHETLSSSHQHSGESQEEAQVTNEIVDPSLNEIQTEQNQKPVAVKSKRQVKSHVTGQVQSSGQINQFSHTQREPVITNVYQVNPHEVAVGVVPLDSAVHANAYEVGSGVEPVDAESDDSSSFLGWLHHGWGHVVNAADTVGDHVGDAIDTVQDFGANAIDKVQDVAVNAAEAVHDAAHTAGDTIVSAYHSAKGKIPELRERIRNLFSRFGLMVQRGADYCIQHLSQAANQVREAEILDKLQQKLAEGNEEVTAFFQTLGEKVTIWTQAQGHANVDEGLITVHHGHADEGVVGGDIIQLEGEQVMPNLFQDQEVTEQLNRLVGFGVITQEELEVLSQLQQQSAQQIDFDQQNHYQQQGGIIQVQSRRSLRNLINALKTR